MLPMERIVGRVQAQDDLLRSLLLMSRQKNVDQEAVHGLGVDRNLSILVLGDRT
jgi:hypothetical protein